jgi:biopolymer transport protein ExbD
MEGNDTLIKHVANRADGIDQEQLSVVMQEIKKRVPDERGVSLLAMPDTSYQSIVAVMDSVSSYKTVAAGSVVRAELFPDISIADAPSERLKGAPQL